MKNKQMEHMYYNSTTYIKKRLDLYQQFKAEQRNQTDQQKYPSLVRIRIVGANRDRFKDIIDGIKITKT